MHDSLFQENIKGKLLLHSLHKKNQKPIRSAQTQDNDFLVLRINILAYKIHINRITAIWLKVFQNSGREDLIQIK